MVTGIQIINSDGEVIEDHRLDHNFRLETDPWEFQTLEDDEFIAGFYGQIHYDTNNIVKIGLLTGRERVKTDQSH